MDTKRLDKKCSRDAISWLPDDVLSIILSLLPTKQVASTSLLSKQWRNVFRLVDNLDFDDSVSGKKNLERDVLPESFKNFVDQTLALQCDYPIKKLSLKCHIGIDNNCQKDSVSRWISNVLQRGVLELDLSIRYGGMYFMPHQLFASKTLVKLTLGTQLYLGKLPSYVSLPSLKTLFIDTVFFECGDLCCVLLAGCPVLEELSVHHNKFPGTPRAISSPTIKRLSVDYDYCKDVYIWNSMSFNLPKLVYLEYSHCALYKYPQVNLESLVEAKLDLYRLVGEMRMPNVTNLLLGIRNVEILHLSPASVYMIYTYCIYELPVFNNLVKLSFGSKNQICWSVLPHLLKQSPKLETLIIKDLNGYTCDVSMPPNKVKLLHILDYRKTVEGRKQLESFLGKFECLEVVHVGVTKEEQAAMDLMMLRRDFHPSATSKLSKKRRLKRRIKKCNTTKGSSHFLVDEGKG